MKKAIQRFIRDDKGNAKVVLIDASTLQPVLNPAEYDIINQTELPYWEPVEDVSQPDVPSKVQPPAEVLNKYIQQSGGDPTHPAVKSAVQTIAATSPKSSLPGRTKGGGTVVNAQPAPSQSSANVSAATAITPADVQKAEAASGAPSAPTVGGAPEVSAPAVASIAPTNASTRSRSPNPNTSISDPAAPASKGMAALTDKYGGKQAKAAVAEATNSGYNIAYNNQKAQRNERLNPDVEAEISDAVKGFFGPGYTASIVSGKGVMKDKFGNPSKKGNHNHPFGTAADFDVIGPDGTKVDSKTMADFGEYTAARGKITGIGGPDEGYMGDGRVHFDTQHKGFASWNVPDRNKLTSAAYLGNTKAERVNPGIPSARPEQSISKGIINSAKSIQGDPSKVSPAQMAGLGLMTTPRTPDQISRMAAAFAGELSPSQLDALAAGDETAKKELAGMITTAENRAAKAKSFDAVFDPKQYNSMMESKQSVTRFNYEKYGQVLRDTIPGFYAGTLTPESYEDTSYYNAKKAQPTWGIMNTGPYGLKNAKQVGDHTFGSVKDRANYKTTDLSGRTTGPTEGGTGRFGAGGLGRGLDSPSESGGRFGGKGLGQGSYSGKGGTDSPSEGAGRFGGSGLGSSKSSKDKDKDSGKSQGPSGGGYGGWGGPR